MDWYTACAGWESQFVDEPNRQSDDILFDTLPGDPGARSPTPNASKARTG